MDIEYSWILNLWLVESPFLQGAWALMSTTARPLWSLGWCLDLRAESESNRCRWWPWGWNQTVVLVCCHCIFAHVFTIVLWSRVRSSRDGLKPATSWQLDIATINKEGFRIEIDEGIQIIQQPESRGGHVVQPILCDKIGDLIASKLQYTGAYHSDCDYTWSIFKNPRLFRSTAQLGCHVSPAWDDTARVAQSPTLPVHGFDWTTSDVNRGLWGL